MDKTYNWLKNSEFGNLFALLIQIDISNDKSFVMNIDNSYKQCKNELIGSFDEIDSSKQKEILLLVEDRINAINLNEELLEREVRLTYLNKLLKKIEELSGVSKTLIANKKEYTINTQLLMLETIGILKNLRMVYSDNRLSKILSIVLNKSEQNIRTTLGQNDRYKQKRPIEDFKKACEEKSLIDVYEIFDETIKTSKN